MEFSIKSGSPEKQRTGCVVVGVFDGRKLSTSAQAIDGASRHYLSEVLRRGDLDGKLGTTLLLHSVPQIPADRVLVVGLGRERDFNEAAYRTALASATKALRSTGASEASICITDLALKRRDTAGMSKQAVLVVIEVADLVDRMKSKHTEELSTQR